jgi:hypothetical protein
MDEIGEILGRASVWSVRSIASQPSSKICDWQAFEVRRTDSGDALSVHLVGRLVADHGGRVTSAIKNVDRASRRVVTNSGRVYQLLGKPGYSSDGEYVWQSWQRIQEVTYAREVTAEFWAALTGPGGDSPATLVGGVASGADGQAS